MSQEVRTWQRDFKSRVRSSLIRALTAVPPMPSDRLSEMLRQGSWLLQDAEHVMKLDDDFMKLEKRLALLACSIESNSPSLRLV